MRSFNPVAGILLNETRSITNAIMFVEQMFQSRCRDSVE